jgi:hypothetical protein
VWKLRERVFVLVRSTACWGLRYTLSSEWLSRTYVDVSGPFSKYHSVTESCQPRVTWWPVEPPRDWLMSVHLPKLHVCAHRFFNHLSNSWVTCVVHRLKLSARVCASSRHLQGPRECELASSCSSSSIVTRPHCPRVPAYPSTLHFLIVQPIGHCPLEAADLGFQSGVRRNSPLFSQPVLQAHFILNTCG